MKKTIELKIDFIHLPPSRKRSFCACSAPPGTWMLSKEICPERSVRYVGAITTQASSFIVGIPVHRKWRDESASPKLVACARVHESSSSLAERGGAVEERVTCVYSGVPCGTGNCERGEEKRESKRIAREW